MECYSKLIVCGCGRLPRKAFMRIGRFPQVKYITRTCGTNTSAEGRNSKPEVRVRFAPSPTGQLHLGGLRTALYNFLYARAHGGRFILRLEDTDQTRLVPGASQKLIEMLQWAGIQMDEGPGFGGSVGPYIQSERNNIYWEHIQQLLQSGAAYYCFCTSRRLELLKKDAVRRGEVPKYDNKCRHLTADEVEARLKTNVPYVIRFKLKTYSDPWQDLVYGPITQDVAAVEGDPVLLKTDRFPTYHYANVVDDHLMGVSHVLRGVEWQLSTTKHILLYKAFGWKPPQFAHLPLLLNRDGTKLSKRQNDIHVQHFRDQGYFPDAVLNLLTSSGGGFKVSDTSGFTVNDLINSFDLSLLKTNSTKLELDRVSEYNKRHLQTRISGAGRHQLVLQVKERAKQTLSEKYTGDFWRHLLDEKYIERILDNCQSRISTVDELFGDKFAFLWFVPDLSTCTDTLTDIVTLETASRVLTETARLLETRDDEKEIKDLSAQLRALPKKLGTKMKSFMTVLRLALTGLTEGPGVAEIISILGRDTSLQRLQQCLHGLDGQRANQVKDIENISS